MTSSAPGDRSTSCATLPLHAARRTPPRTRRRSARGVAKPARRSRRARAPITSIRSMNSGSCWRTASTIASTTSARLPRRVGRVGHPHQAIEREARDRVHHRGAGGERDHIARRLDRLLLRLALDRLQPIGAGPRRDVAQLAQDANGVVLEQGRQPRVALPRVDDGALVDVARLAVDRRDDGARLAQLDVALALLLGVVERVAVERAPDELPRHVLEAELEVRVLVDGVVTGVEGELADRVALLLGDLGGGDDARRVAGAGGGNRAVVGHGRRVAQRHARRARPGGRSTRHPGHVTIVYSSWFDW